MRGSCYCEVLVVGTSGVTVAVDIYNTIGLGNCPLGEWGKLSSDALVREMGAQYVLLNGPRYWTVDGAEGAEPVEKNLRRFGEVSVRKAGHVELSIFSAISLNNKYTARPLQRRAVWSYAAGRKVYELVEPSGRVWIMLAHTKDAGTSEGALETLGSRLRMPGGWSYRARVLDKELRVGSPDGSTEVVQDELENTYQLLIPVP